MNSSMLFQVLVNLIFAAGFVAIWIRLNKPAKDDPRLSRGLQLLQSKIAILEDLSDQVERQVQQVAQLMEVKARDLQKHIEKSDDQIRQIETVTSKSLEVARIFQDRIPHEEMMDRKSTLKYVKAARLANKGMSIDDIADQVDLSRGELEFVTKVNREQLQFSEEDLPDWAKELAGGIETESAGSVLENTISEAQPLMRVSDRSAESLEPLDQLGRKFREAFENGLNQESAPSGQLQERNTPAPKLIVPDVQKAKEPAPFNRAAALASKHAGERLIQRVVFPNVNY